jgi:hypothetical protein
MVVRQHFPLRPCTSPWSRYIGRILHQKKPVRLQKSPFVLAGMLRSLHRFAAPPHSIGGMPEPFLTGALLTASAADCCTCTHYLAPPIRNRMTRNIRACPRSRRRRAVEAGRRNFKAGWLGILRMYIYHALHYHTFYQQLLSKRTFCSNIARLQSVLQLGTPIFFHRTNIPTLQLLFNSSSSTHWQSQSKH